MLWARRHRRLYFFQRGSRLFLRDKIIRKNEWCGKTSQSVMRKYPLNSMKYLKHSKSIPVLWVSRRLGRIIPRGRVRARPRTWNLPTRWSLCIASHVRIWLLICLGLFMMMNKHRSVNKPSNLCVRKMIYASDQQCLWRQTNSWRQMLICRVWKIVWNRYITSGFKYKNDLVRKPTRIWPI